MAKRKGSRKRKFSWPKAGRNTAVSVGVGIALSGLVAVAEHMAPGSSTVITDLWQPVANAAGLTVAGGIPVGMAAEYLNHKLDDPSPVFDGPTTALFNIVGMVLCFLLFVIPALQLDNALHPNEPLPGNFGYLALFLSVFLVTILRGLLINLSLVREEEDYSITN